MYYMGVGLYCDWILSRLINEAGQFYGFLDVSI